MGCVYAEHLMRKFLLQGLGHHHTLRQRHLADTVSVDNAVDPKMTD